MIYNKHIPPSTHLHVIEQCFKIRNSSSQLLVIFWVWRTPLHFPWACANFTQKHADEAGVAFVFVQQSFILVLTACAVGSGTICGVIGRNWLRQPLLLQTEGMMRTKKLNLNYLVQKPGAHYLKPKGYPSFRPQSLGTWCNNHEERIGSELKLQELYQNKFSSFLVSDEEIPIDQYRWCGAYSGLTGPREP